MYDVKAKKESIRRIAAAAVAQVEERERNTLHELNLSEQSVWGLGDADFPLAENILRADMEQAKRGRDNFVARGASGWRAYSEDPAVDHMLDPFPECDEAAKQCGEVYGLGRCRQDFTSDQIARMESLVDIINSVVFHLSQGELERAPVLWLDALDSEGRVVGRKLIMLAWSSAGNNAFQVYARCTLQNDSCSDALQAIEPWVGRSLNIELCVHKLAHRWLSLDMITTQHLACELVRETPPDVSLWYSWQHWQVVTGSAHRALLIQIHDVAPLQRLQRQARTFVW